MTSKKKPSQLLKGQDAAAVLQSIFVPLAEKIAWVQAHADVVFVVHKPGDLARQMLQTLRVKRECVFGMSAFDAVRVANWDLLTRRWLSDPADDDQTKVFLVAGNGTALLTLTCRGGAVLVDKAPDLFLAEEANVSDRVVADPNAILMLDEQCDAHGPYIIDGLCRASVLVKLLNEKASAKGGPQSVLISTEHGVVVGRRFLEEIRDGKRAPETVRFVMGPTAQLFSEEADVIKTEPIRIVVPPT